MEEDTISLRDYINVIKKDKILITAIFLVIVIAASIFSFSLPDEYLSEARLSYTPNQKIPLSDAVEILKSSNIIQRTASQGGEISKREAVYTSNLKIDYITNNNYITIQFKGNNPETIEKYFENNIKVAVYEVNKKYLEKSQLEYSRSENLSIFYKQQKDEIYAKMKIELAKEADLEIARLEELSNRLASFGARDRQIDIEYNISELKSIKKGRIGSIVAQEMISSNPELNLLNQQFISTNNKFVDSITKKELERNNVSSEVLEIIAPPTNPVLKSPQRFAYMVIAAIIGLFVGVLAAFFKNYTEGSM